MIEMELVDMSCRTKLIDDTLEVILCFLWHMSGPVFEQ